MNNPNQFNWTGATEREDNTPYSPKDRRGYNVYIYPAGDSPSDIIFTATQIGESNDFEMPISDLGNPLTEGDWEIIVTDVDTEGRESDYSPPFIFSIVVARPKAPTGLSVS